MGQGTIRDREPKGTREPQGQGTDPAGDLAIGNHTAKGTKAIGEPFGKGNQGIWNHMDRSHF
jgi:hypothetical protein